MTAKFTKGPWRWVEDRNTGGFYGLYAGDNPVVYPQRCNDGDDGLAWFSTDESYYGETALTEADAALIARAPEMYEMLERLQAFCDEVTAENTTLYGEAKRLESAVDALLAKARGEV